MTILDAGAGDQHHRESCKHLKYTSQDFGKYDGKGNDVGLQTNVYDYGKLDITSDIISIPVWNNSFDYILCTEVLEHIPHPELAIKEFSRILKENGRLILTAPFCSLTHFAPYHFVTGFNSYWYENTFEDFDIKIISIEPYGDYFEYLAQEIHRIIPVAVQYCNVSKVHRDDIKALEDVILMLEKYSKIKNDSWELLNFGFLVLAEKIGQ